MDSLKDWLLQNPPQDDQFTASISSVAQEILGGQTLSFAVREFLDQIALMSPSQIQQAILERPQDTGEARHDAYLGALAEHLAAVHQLSRPPWCCEPIRFLSRMWFVSDVEGFRALAIVESPAAFRRRGIFISRGSLHRV